MLQRPNSISTFISRSFPSLLALAAGCGPSLLEPGPDPCEESEPSTVLPRTEEYGTWFALPNGRLVVGSRNDTDDRLQRVAAVGICGEAPVELGQASHFGLVGDELTTWTDGAVQWIDPLSGQRHEVFSRVNYPVLATEHGWLAMEATGGALLLHREPRDPQVEPTVLLGATPASFSTSVYPWLGAVLQSDGHRAWAVDADHDLIEIELATGDAHRVLTAVETAFVVDDGERVVWRGVSGADELAPIAITTLSTGRSVTLASEAPAGWRAAATPTRWLELTQGSTTFVHLDRLDSPNLSVQRARWQATEDDRLLVMGTTSLGWGVWRIDDGGAVGVLLEPGRCELDRAALGADGITVTAAACPSMALPSDDPGGEAVVLIALDGAAPQLLGTRMGPQHWIVPDGRVLSVEPLDGTEPWSPGDLYLDDAQGAPWLLDHDAYLGWHEPIDGVLYYYVAGEGLRRVELP